ncbi:MAG: YraN family protein [Patescibacteria group bacterium]|jgi:putative endonuclease
MERNKILGARGEALARRYLESKGYRLIATNYKVSYPEIDIIAQLKTSWVFIEVKTRTKTLDSIKENPLSRWQVVNLKRAILDYVNKNHLNLEAVRLDLIIILVDKQTNLAELKHYRDIF